MDIFKKWWFYLILILLIPVVAFAALLAPNGQTPAFLQSVTGTVQVDQGEGYAAASAGMELFESDRIMTGEGTAVVVLYEHIILRLEPNSEITIAELAKRRQRVEQSGSVWTKVARLSGTDNYEASTPTVVATVRGTTLRVRFNATSNMTYELLVGEGQVIADDSSCLMQPVTKNPTCNMQVSEQKKLVLENDMYAYKNLTPEDIADIREQLQHELTVLRELRMREVFKNGMIMRVARNRYDATNDDIEEYLIDIDEGRRSEEQLRSEIPLMTPDIKRILAYNAAIRSVMSTIEEYDG